MSRSMHVEPGDHRRDTTIPLSEARAVNPCRFDLAAQLAASVLRAALRQRGRRLDFREVFDREQLSIAFDDPNSNDIHIRIKKVLAMIRRLRPLIADVFGIGTLGHILGE